MTYKSTRIGSGAAKGKLRLRMTIGRGEGEALIEELGEHFSFRANSTTNVVTVYADPSGNKLSIQSDKKAYNVGWPLDNCYDWVPHIALNKGTVEVTGDGKIVGSFKTCVKGKKKRGKNTVKKAELAKTVGELKSIGRVGPPMPCVNGMDPHDTPPDRLTFDDEVEVRLMGESHVMPLGRYMAMLRSVEQYKV